MKKLYILIVALFLGCGAFAQAPTMAFVDVIGSGGNDYIQSICGDPAGNVYIAGTFTNAVDFDPGPGLAQATSVVGTGGDAFIAKYNSLGAYQWVVNFGGNADDAVLQVVADANAVYVTGYVQGNNINFNPLGTGATQSTSGGNDIFLAKYSTAGGILSFVRVLGAAGTDGGQSVALDASGSIYITGSFTDAVDFDPLSTAGAETSWGGEDMFLAKYNNAGAYLWSADLGSTDLDQGKYVYVSGNDVWIGGFFSDTFYPDPNYYQTNVPNLGLTDGYFGQYNATNGNLIWGGFIRSPAADVVQTLWADATNVYTGGFFSGTAVMVGDQATSKTVNTNGFSDGFIARHTVADKKLQWINTFGGASNESVDVLTSDGGSIFAVGGFQSSMDMDPSPATSSTLNNNTGQYDAYLVKYNYLTGAHANSFSIGGTQWDEATSVALVAGYIYWAGIYGTNNIDIDPSAAVTSTKANQGGLDGFFARFNPNEPPSSASALTFSNIGSSTFDVAFTPAGGFPDGYLTVFRVGAPPTGQPVDGITYTPGSVVGDGSVLYVGPAPTYNAVGGSPSTQYFLTVYPYNGAGTATNYRVASPVSSSVTTATPATEPTASPAGINATAITTKSYTITFGAASGTLSGYIAVRASGGVPAIDPVDGVNYTVGSSISNGTVAYVGTGLTFNETGLTPGTQYFYKIYSYNGTGGSINYRATVPATGNVTTKSLATEPTAQATNLVFSNIMPTEFDFQFDASPAGNVTGYIGIRGTNTLPTFVPEDGVEYNGGQDVNNGVNGEVVTFVGSGLSWGYSSGDLVPDTEYFFKVYAYNGSGDEINYLQTLPLTNSQVTSSDQLDSTAPVIVDNTQTSSAGNVPVKVTATITDAVGVTAAHVEYYPVNSTRSGTQQMVIKSGNTWEATIEASYNTEQGVEYKIFATDEAGNDVFSPEWKTIAVEVTGDGLTIPYNAGTAKENYRIVSVPLNLNKKSVSDVFGDDLGDYDKSKYRLFLYGNGNTTELSGSSTIEIGKGYWFIAAETKTVDSGPGTTLRAGVNAPVTIPVSPGWNLLGDPFNFDLDWSLVTSHLDNADKGIGNFKSFNGTFNPATQLKKMSGGFVMIQSIGNGQLRIPAYDEGSRMAAPAPPVDFQQAIAANTWGVDLMVKSGSYQNPFAGFGMHPEASEQNDKYDDFTLPRFMDYLELNYDKKLYGSSFTKDIVPTAAQHVWEFEVASNLPDEIVELSWDNSYFGSTDVQLVLWDVEQQRAIDMKTQKAYSFERSRSGIFKVFFGNEAFVKNETKPYIPVFHSASPVPSSGNVTFAFSVPESQGDIKTSLIIYNMMGQKVANLLDSSLPAGYQQTVWNIEDGAKPAAGVYISILKFGETTLQKRLIIR